MTGRDIKEYNPKEKDVKQSSRFRAARMYYVRAAETAIDASGSHETSIDLPAKIPSYIAIALDGLGLEDQ